MEPTDTQTDAQAASSGTAKTAVVFVGAVVAFSALFILLDYALMSAQGLTLFFHG